MSERDFLRQHLACFGDPEAHCKNDYLESDGCLLAKECTDKCIEIARKRYREMRKMWRGGEI